MPSPTPRSCQLEAQKGRRQFRAHLEQYNPADENAFNAIVCIAVIQFGILHEALAHACHADTHQVYRWVNGSACPPKEVRRNVKDYLLINL